MILVSYHPPQSKAIPPELFINNLLVTVKPEFNLATSLYNQLPIGGETQASTAFQDGAQIERPLAISIPVTAKHFGKRTRINSPPSSSWDLDTCIRP